MPEFYNEAALLMYALQQKGLVFRTGVDARDAIWRLAELMAVYLNENSSLTHAGAASWMLDDLEKSFVRRNAAKRPKLVAIIGTTLGNLQMGRRAA